MNKSRKVVGRWIYNGKEIKVDVLEVTDRYTEVKTENGKVFTVSHDNPNESVFYG